MSELSQYAATDGLPSIRSAGQEHDMANTPASVLQRHRDLSHGFALVAPLGGGAVTALHSLQQDVARGPFLDLPGAPAGMRPLAQEPTARAMREQGWAATAFARTW